MQGRTPFLRVANENVDRDSVSLRNAQDVAHDKVVALYDGLRR
jgi:hypothetical protein